MDNKVTSASDNALSAIHESGYITLEDFIRMNNGKEIDERAFVSAETAI